MVFIWRYYQNIIKGLWKSFEFVHVKKKNTVFPQFEKHSVTFNLQIKQGIEN